MGQLMKHYLSLNCDVLFWCASSNSFLFLFILYSVFLWARLYIFSIIYFIPPLHAWSHDLLVTIIQNMIIDLYMDAWQ